MCIRDRAWVERKAPGWDVAIDVAGGTINGILKASTAPAAQGEKPALAINGHLETRDVELDLLLRRPAGHSPGSPMRGRLTATTTLTAEADGLGGLLEHLRTHSQFSVQHAVLHGVDLVRAVKSVGLNQGGETRLDTLTGQVVTQGLSLIQI